jgi:hypothetical protein
MIFFLGRGAREGVREEVLCLNDALTGMSGMGYLVCFCFDSRFLSPRQTELHYIILVCKRLLRSLSDLNIPTNQSDGSNHLPE